AAGRTDRAVRDRHAVRGTQAMEVPPLHAAGKTLADRGTGHINELADHEMVRRDLGPNRNERVLGHTELRYLALGLDFGDCEMAAFGLGYILDAARAGAKLQRDVAILILGTVCHHRAMGEPHHRHRHVLAAVPEDAAHSDLL